MSENSLRNLKKALRQFPKNIQKNIANGAIRAGCKPILTKAKSLVPYEQGDLDKSIQIRKRKSKNRNITHYSVSAGNYVQTIKGKEKIIYAAFIEWGYTKPNGTAIMAYPFMRPAMESEAHKCIEETKKYYAKRIDKEIEKARAT